MKVIAVVGVSGSGKTTLISDLKEEFEDKCEVMEETSRGDILGYLGFPLTFNPKKENPVRVSEYDFGRVEHQLLMEKKFINDRMKSNKCIIIDKAAPCSLVYALTMSSRFAGIELTSIIKETIEHSYLYNTVIFLPYIHFDTTKDNLMRNVIDPYILETQNAVLEKIVSWLHSDVYNTGYFGRRVRLRRVLDYIIA